MDQASTLSKLLPAPKAAALLPELSFGGLEDARATLALENFPPAQQLIAGLQKHAETGSPSLLLDFHHEPELGPEAYKLRASANSVSISASSTTGKRHALWTLLQWLELNAEANDLDGLLVEDEPDLPQRGVMLDISRDRVPTLATACQLVELFASWKLNQLQLYTEHTFAYSGASAVWGEASPWTAEEIQALDRHAASHGIELIPNQQSFGHLHRWLVHSPYEQLAEVPEGVVHPFHPTKQPFSICPNDPSSLRFLASLYDELLPNFQSQRINVGLDETFDLGLGKSKDEVERRGVAEVYMDFLIGVHGLVSDRGHKMQFWADIILNHPEVLERLPSGCEAVLWGYEADHPLDKEASLLQDAGVDFLIAPGTSSWQSFGGRTDNCIANLRSASSAARARGAAGLLITDWGDRGHIQPLPISYLGFMHGAELAWNGSAGSGRSDEEIGAQLDQHAFKEPNSGFGAFTLELGRAADACGVEAHNLSALFFPIGFPEHSLPSERVPGLDRASFEAAKRPLLELSERHAALRPKTNAGELAHKELGLALDLMRCSRELGIVRASAADDTHISELPREETRAIAEELHELGERHAALWLVRSRPGGLADSVTRLQGLADVLLGKGSQTP